MGSEMCIRDSPNLDPAIPNLAVTGANTPVESFGSESFAVNEINPNDSDEIPVSLDTPNTVVAPNEVEFVADATPPVSDTAETPSPSPSLAAANESDILDTPETISDSSTSEVDPEVVANADIAGPVSGSIAQNSLDDEAPLPIETDAFTAEAESKSEISTVANDIATTSEPPTLTTPEDNADLKSAVPELSLIHI